MWTWNSLTFLAVIAVGVSSFPSPDESAYKIPTVGSGPRSQYYVLHNDGTFKYGFDTGDGAFESVKSQTVGNRDGKFGYVDPDGNNVRLEYQAGLEGFVAQGDHIPKPSQEYIQAFAEASQNKEPFVDPLASDDSDASYGFQFQSEDHSRNEQSNADGTVTGSYSYVDENGVKRSFNYKAGGGIGFTIEGDGLSQGDQQSTTNFAGAHQQTSQVSSNGGFPTSTFGLGHSAPAKPAFQSQNVEQANIASTRSKTPGDASYSFSYETNDHSRSESSDPNLNVDGTFSFVADDGKRRTVNYAAGSGTGFEAQGDHLPKAPTHESSSNVRMNGVRSGVNGFHRTQAPQSGSHSPASNFIGSQRGSTQAPQSGSHSPASNFIGSHRGSPVEPRPYEEANIVSSFSPEGPYSFSYETSSHSRTESGDADNNVVGNFAFVADDDGQRREVNYEAGSSTGFIAEGDHIPTGPIVPGAPSGQPTGRIVPVSSVPFVDPLASTDADASYNFEFESETYSRTESADKDGNIVGTYTIVDDDGTRRTYNFKAGQGVGYETEEVGQTQGPVPNKQGLSRKPTEGHSFSSRPQTTRPTSIHSQASQSFASQPPQHSQHFIPQSHNTRKPTQKQPQLSHRPSSGHSQQTQHHTSPGVGGSYLPPSQSFSSPQSSQDFTLNTYEASPDAEKYGYVLKFH